MKVNFYAMYRQAVGSKTVDIPFPQGATVRQLIDEVIRRYPKLRRDLLDEQGALYGHVRVVVDGRDALFLEDNLETRLSADNTVDIFPPVGGG